MEETRDFRYIPQKYTPVPEGWPENSTFKADHVPAPEDFFDCGAPALAEKLLGQYLYCHSSHIVVRILETEAYPEADATVYNAVFSKRPGNPQFKTKGGLVVACTHFGAPASVGDNATFDTFLYVTAGPANSGDVVLLRSCQAIEGHNQIEKNCRLVTYPSPWLKNNAMVGPVRVSNGLGNEWEEGSAVLYQDSGMQLSLCDPSAEKVMLRGPRVLPSYLPPDVLAVTDEYRFALKTRKPAFDYWKKTTLTPYTPALEQGSCSNIK